METGFCDITQLVTFSGYCLEGSPGIPSLTRENLTHLPSTFYVMETIIPYTQKYRTMISYCVVKMIATTVIMIMILIITLIMIISIGDKSGGGDDDVMISPCPERAK